MWDSVPLMMEGGHSPYMTYYPSARPSEAAIIIFAGGGYGHRSRHEGEGYAQYFSAEGFHCFVVHYRVNPYVFPVELLDARRAVRCVRYDAQKYGINPGKIAVMGSSAGGHLAALVSTYRDAIEGEGIDEIDAIDPTPNAHVLCYPVLDPQGNLGTYMHLLGADRVQAMWRKVTPTLIADKNTPICFMWHCEGDDVVDASNVLRYSQRLLDLGVSQETHIYPRGRHGVGLVKGDDRFIGHEYMESWAPMAVKWFKLNGFID